MTHVDTPHSICRFGIARQDITPPVGIYHRMWGAASHDRAAGVHRPLFATVMIFEALEGSARSDQRQIVIALDHCLMTTPEMETFLDVVSAEGGVSRDTIVVIFSHTHAAGLLMLDRVDLPGGDLIPGYFRTLEQSVVTGVKEALANLQEATIVYGQAHCDLAGHRDFYDEQTRQFVCGFNPAECADDTAVVARVTDVNGELLATMVNYACHPTTLAWQNQLISPDYPGAMRETIERDTGAPCVFIQGASAELGPREGYVGDTAVADRNGRQLAYAALSRLVALPPPRTSFAYTGPVISGATLGTWAHQPVKQETRPDWSTFCVRRRTINFPYRASLPTIESVTSDREQWLNEEKQARAAGNPTRAADCRAMVERQTRLLARLQALPPGEYPLSTVVWRMGDAVWVALPGEPYSVLQRSLRERFPGKTLVVAPLAFGWGPSYLPPKELYDRGLYQESIAILAPGSLERLIDELAAIIGECTQ